MASGNRLFRGALILLAALLVLPAPSASAFSWPWKKKKKVETVAPAPKKSDYDKFIETKGLKIAVGFTRIYSDKDKIYLEIADSLLEREVLLSTVIESSSNVTIPIGHDVSHMPVYRICKRDSSIVFTSPSGPFEVSDDGILSALSLSDIEPVRFVFPFKCKTDSSYVVDVSSLLDYNNKDAFDLKGLSWGNFESVASFSLQSEKSLFRGIGSFGNSVGARFETTAELSINGLFGELATKPSVTCDIAVLLSPLPFAGDFTSPKKDPRIGTSVRNVRVFDEFKGSKTEARATRWDLSGDKTIVVRVDTLLKASWRAAVCEGILAWNEAFRGAGLGDKIEVLPYDAKTVSEDPLVSTVSLSPAQSQGLGARISVSDEGQILSCKITIPGEYLLGVRRRSIYAISDVDPRYQKYNLSDEAVCEVLRAEVMQVFGRCLGLSANMAGSLAYTPSQLRSPEFTKAHGITGSVLDDVLFNKLARPGDKEKGVVTIIDRVGDYDKYAIAWLYADAPADESFLYVGRQTASRLSDPRGIPYDMGSDIVAFAKTNRERQKFVAANAYDWLAAEDVPESYSMLFVDWIYLNSYYVSYYMSTYLGGMYGSDPFADSQGKKKLTAVDAGLQREVLQTILDLESDYGWLEKDPRLFKDLAGANVSIADYTKMIYLPATLVFRRLPFVVASGDLAGSRFEASEMFNTLEQKILPSDRLSHMDDMMLSMYINGLISNSDVLKANMDKAFNKTAFVEDEAFSSLAVPASYSSETDVVCYKQLTALLPKLKGLKARATGDSAYRVDYLCKEVEAALDKN